MKPSGNGHGSSTGTAAAVMRQKCSYHDRLTKSINQSVALGVENGKKLDHLTRFIEKNFTRLFNRTLEIESRLSNLEHHAKDIFDEHTQLHIERRKQATG